MTWAPDSWQQKPAVQQPTYPDGAALHVQRFQDPVTMAAVDQVESLAAGLSRKIWQKIMILTQPDSAPPTLS